MVKRYRALDKFESVSGVLVMYRDYTRDIGELVDLLDAHLFHMVEGFIHEDQRAEFMQTSREILAKFKE